MVFDDEIIQLDEKFDTYTVAFEKNKDFINNNIKGLLLNTTKKNFLQNIKVSVIIPCYNCEKFILSCIRSIQNQDFSNFEIIIVNDGSNDDCLFYLEELQEKDERIKIMSNKMTTGILYSRSVGALSAKGKYIFTLDGDDMYLSKDVLYSITKIALKGNYDLIIFNSIYSTLKPDVNTTKIIPSRFEIKHKPNVILFQPNLGYYPISPSNNIEKPSFNEMTLHRKCIKTQIYHKALEKLGEKRYMRYMLNCEDTLANYAIMLYLFNTAKVAKFVPKYGYIYRNNKGSNVYIQKDKVINLIYYIYVYDIIIDFSLNLPRNKEVLVNFILFILNNIYLKDAINTNKYNYNLFISFLNRFFRCKYISDGDKDRVRKKGKFLKFIKYHF